MRLIPKKFPLVYCRAFSSDFTTMTGTPAIMTYTAQYDALSMVSGTNITIKKTGLYKVSCAAALISLVWSTGTFATTLYVNGVATRNMGYFNYATGSGAALSQPFCKGDTLIKLNKNDVLTFYGVQTQTGATTLSGGIDYNFIEVLLVG